MSWSATVPATIPADFDTAVDAAVVTSPQGEQPPQVIDQLEAAKAAAKALVASGAIGTGVAFSASLSGHANLEHEPTEGWANDCITVSVAQQNRPA